MDRSRIRWDSDSWQQETRGNGCCCSRAGDVRGRRGPLVPLHQVLPEGRVTNQGIRVDPVLHIDPTARLSGLRARARAGCFSRA